MASTPGVSLSIPRCRATDPHTNELSRACSRIPGRCSRRDLYRFYRRKPAAAGALCCRAVARSPQAPLAARTLPLLLFMGWTLVSLAFSPDPRGGFPQIKKFYVYLMLWVVFSLIRTLAEVRT